MASSDEELVARCLVSRNQQAFTELVKRHQSRVRGFLRQLSGDPAFADDLAQETFLRSWRMLHTFSGKGRFVAWLMRVAYREFLQAMRRKHRDERLLHRVAADAYTTHDPPQSLHDQADLSRFLAELTPEERLAIVLGYGLGFTNEEITAITAMPLGTVKSHIRRGRLRIHQRFGLKEMSDA